MLPWPGKKMADALLMGSLGALVGAALGTNTLVFWKLKVDIGW